MHNTTRSTRRSIVVGDLGSDGLKAERIQEALAAAAAGQGTETGTRLKAERIQIAFRDLPGWELQRGAAIARTFELGSGAAVGRFLQYVGELAIAGDAVPDLAVEGGRVTVVLPVLGGSWLEVQDFELAQAFEMSAA